MASSSKYTGWLVSIRDRDREVEHPLSAEWLYAIEYAYKIRGRRSRGQRFRARQRKRQRRIKVCQTKKYDFLPKA